MDSAFDNLDLELPSEVTLQKPVQYERKPKPMYVKNLDPVIWVCGSKDKTDNRLKDLETAGDRNGVVHLEIRDTAPIGEVVQQVKQRMADYLNGQLKLKVGDIRDNKKCYFRLACDKGWDGDHQFSHAKAAWIIWQILEPLYKSAQRSQGSQDIHRQIADMGEWDIDCGMTTTQSEDGYEVHRHPASLNYDLVARPRVHANTKELENLFRDTIMNFFAGKKCMRRIGATKASKEYPVKLCRGPFCYRTLMAKTAAESTTACRMFHSDDVSFLTSLARVLVEFKITRKPVSELPQFDSTPTVKPRREFRSAPAMRKKEPEQKVSIANKFMALTEDDEEAIAS